MERRRLLRASTTAGAVFIAGCTGSSEDEDIQDSDGDGVIDSEDYAPNDPTVQVKSDLEGASTGVNQTDTDTEGVGPDTEGSDSESEDSDTDTEDSGSDTDTDEEETPAPEPNTLQVDDEAFTGDSYISAYSSDEVTVVVDPTDPEISDRTLSNSDVQIVAANYPRESKISDSISRSSLNNSSKTTVSISMDINDARAGEPLHYMLILVPAGETIETADSTNLRYLHETDPFVLREDGATIERTDIPELESLGDDSGRNHDRTAKEGIFDLTFEGRTAGESWQVGFYTFKSAYVESVRQDHGRSRPQFVSYEMSTWFGWEVAKLLKTEAEENGFTDKQTQVEFVIDFIQHLPYVPDDVSTGYDDYTKFTMETLTECGGDCEDTAILLTSILQSDPFNYDLILIQPPGHMAAGIKGADDLPGYYWEYEGNKYYYIETTGVGWGVGDLPEEYRNQSARVYQV